MRDSKIGQGSQKEDRGPRSSPGGPRNRSEARSRLGVPRTGRGPEKATMRGPQKQARDPRSKPGALKADQALQKHFRDPEAAGQGPRKLARGPRSKLGGPETGRAQKQVRGPRDKKDPKAGGAPEGKHEEPKNMPGGPEAGQGLQKQQARGPRSRREGAQKQDGVPEADQGPRSRLTGPKTRRAQKQVRGPRDRRGP